MRHEEPTITAPTASPVKGLAPSRSLTPAQADDALPPVTSGARPLRAWAWPLVTGSLVAATCLTLANFASVWLVPPYLALMAWVLGFPKALRGDTQGPTGPWARAIQALRDRRAGATRDGGGLERDDRLDVATGSDSKLPEPNDQGTEPDAPVQATEIEPGHSPVPAPSLVKAKRGKGRGKKARSTQAARSEGGQAATWVRVGPGKFVRADVASVETETEAPRPEPPDAAGPADAQGVENEEAAEEVTAGLEVGPGPELVGEDDGGREPGPRPDGGSVEDSEGDNGNAPDAPFDSEDAFAARVPESVPALDLDPRPESAAESFEDAEASAEAGPRPQGGPERRPRSTGVGVAQKVGQGVRIRLSRAPGRVRRRRASAPRFGQPGTRRLPAGRPPRRRYVPRSRQVERSHPPRSPPAASRLVR